jgi:hypothetical protein
MLNVDRAIESSIDLLKRKKLINKGDYIIHLASTPMEVTHKTNMLKVTKVSECSILLYNLKSANTFYCKARLHATIGNARKNLLPISSAMFPLLFFCPTLASLGTSGVLP